MKPVQILELFGGIGAPRCAMRNIGMPVPILEEIFKHTISKEQTA